MVKGDSANVGKGGRRTDGEGALRDLERKKRRTGLINSSLRRMLRPFESLVLLNAPGWAPLKTALNSNGSRLSRADKRTHARS